MSPEASGASGPKSITLHVDGAARGNPGPAGAGAVLSGPDGRACGRISLYLGEATNNVAEYSALLLGLQEALRIGARRVKVQTDSELLARQLTGRYRVKDKHLRVLHALIGHLAGGFERFAIEHVPRSRNRQADRLANQAVTEGLRREGGSRRSARTAAQTPASGQRSLFPEGR